MMQDLKFHVQPTQLQHLFVLRKELVRKFLHLDNVKIFMIKIGSLRDPENEEVFSFFILDILPPQPQELEAMNITDKSFILKWKTVTGEGSLDERSLYQVMHTFYK